MDSSPDLSVKLRRGSSDSRDSFYMGFAQGIDSDIEEVTTVQNVPPPPPPQYQEPEELPIEVPTEESLSETVPCEEQQSTADEPEVISEELAYPLEPAQLLIEQIPPPPPLPDDDEDETNTSITVIQSKHKTPSSSSSSISSALNELAADEGNQTVVQPIDSPKPRQQSVEAEIVSNSPSSHKSPPRRLHLHKESRPRNFDSDSIDSINAIDCKIDDDNRDDSSPTDSMPPAPTPPPLEHVLSLEKR